jgi:virC1 protein
VTVGRAKDSCEITIIDTPPGGSDLLQEAIDSADVIIVPTSPSPLDVQRVWKTLEATAAKPTGVLLTNTEPHTTLLSDTRSIFDEENIFVFDTMIPKRQAIKRSMGTLPDDLYGYDILFDEVMEAI